MDKLKARHTISAGGCWLYSGKAGSNGYRTIGYLGKTRPVHRVAYELFVGLIPEGLTIDHECHNRDLSCKGGPTCQHRACFNPDHLAPKTGAENTSAGRAGAYIAARTHCPAGHAYVTYGVQYPSGKGRRECRECKRLRSAVFDARRRAERVAAKGLVD